MSCKSRKESAVLSASATLLYQLTNLQHFFDIRKSFPASVCLTELTEMHGQCMARGLHGVVAADCVAEDFVDQGVYQFFVGVS